MNYKQNAIISQSNEADKYHFKRSRVFPPRNSTHIVTLRIFRALPQSFKDKLKAADSGFNRYRTLGSGLHLRLH
jgi:hypothetical protein